MVDHNIHTGNDGTMSPRGLNIQFSKSSPEIESTNLPSPVSRSVSPPFSLGNQSLENRRFSGGTKRPATVSSDLLNDLKQVQRELNWLARTENFTLSRRVSTPCSSPHQRADPRRRSVLSDDSNDSFLDEDSTVFDEASTDGLSVNNMTEELRVLGSEFDLKDAVVKRLAEIREKRNASGDSEHDSEPEVIEALNRLKKDLGHLMRAVDREVIDRSRNKLPYVPLAIGVAIVAYLCSRFL